MKILVINIALRPKSDLKLFPIGLSFITAAIKKAGYNFELLDLDVHRYSDDYVEKYLTANKFDVVCIGCIVTGYRYVKNLVEMVKRIHPETITIVGNTVASSIPSILFKSMPVDVAVMGEGDITIAEVLNRLSVSKDLKSIDGIRYRENSGEVVENKIRKPIGDLNKISLPDWDSFIVDEYIKATSEHYVSEPYPIPHEQIRAFPVNTARGCLFRCTFCYHVFAGMKYRWRSPQSIVGEIKELKRRYKVNYIMFHDELTFFSRRQARETIDCFLENDLNVYWVADSRSDLFRSKEDLDLAKDFKRAGCVGLSYSLETADLDILKMMNKKLNPDDFSRQREILDQAGLVTWTSLVFGYPIESKKSIRKTIDCCIANGVYPSAGYLLPQPGTEMYEYALCNGYIKDEQEYLLSLGDRQDLRINMTKMSDEELVGEVTEGLKRCNRCLGINLKEEQLIKTGFYRAVKHVDNDHQKQ